MCKSAMLIMLLCCSSCAFAQSQGATEKWVTNRIQEAEQRVDGRIAQHETNDLVHVSGADRAAWTGYGPRLSFVEAETSRWDAAWGWGDHSTAGYLPVLTWLTWLETNTVSVADADAALHLIDAFDSTIRWEARGGTNLFAARGGPVTNLLIYFNGVYTDSDGPIPFQSPTNFPTATVGGGWRAVESPLGYTIDDPFDPQDGMFVKTGTLFRVYSPTAGGQGGLMSAHLPAIVTPGMYPVLIDTAVGDMHGFAVVSQHVGYAQSWLYDLTGIGEGGLDAYAVDEAIAVATNALVQMYILGSGTWMTVSNSVAQVVGAGLTNVVRSASVTNIWSGTQAQWAAVSNAASPAVLYIVLEDAE